MASNRSILLIGAGVLALVVVSVIVVLVLRKGPQAFPAGSPQAALSRYLAAWDDNDIEAAYGLLSQGAHDRVAYSEYQSAANSYQAYGQTAHDVTIDRVTGTGDRVTIQVTVQEFYGDGLSANVSRSPRSIPMIHEPDGWKIDDALVWLDPGPFVPKAL
jgi:hypothetical protein